MPFIDANGVSLHYDLAGARGRSVVLMHELGGTLHSWDAIAPRLSARYRVLRYDQRGAGLSEKVRTDFTNDIRREIGRQACEELDDAGLALSGQAGPDLGR